MHCRLFAGIVIVAIVTSWSFGAGEKTEKTTEGAEKKDSKKEEANEIEEIVITAKRASVEQGERPIFSALPPRDLFQRPLTESPGLDTATSIIGQEEIRWLNAYSIVDAMRYTPGAWTESRGRKVKKFFSVRGQRYPYPGYLVDGAWFREFHETNYFMSAANVERIELLRSAASLLWSPGGMTGLVNVVPRTFEEQETWIETQWGSHDTSRTRVTHGDTIDNLSYSISAGYYHTKGPDHWNAGENMSNISARIVYRPIKELTFSLSAYSIFGDRELEMAKPPASNRMLMRKDHFDPMHTFLVIGKVRMEPNDRMATEVTTNFSSRRFHGHRAGAMDWLEEDYEIGMRLIQTQKIGDSNILRFGGMLNYWDCPNGKRFYVGRPGNLRTYSGVVVDEHDFGRLRLNAGYRISRTRIREFGGFNVEGSARGLRTVRIKNEWEDPLKTFMAGASFELTDTWSLHGNFSVGEVASEPGMLDADLKRPGTETRFKYDLGIKRAWDGFGEISLTGFFVKQKDAALTTPTKVTVNGEDYALYENTDRQNYGIELDVRSKRFDNGLQFFFNAVAMKTRRLNFGEWTPDQEVPNCVMGGGLSWLYKNIEFSLTAKRVGQYENDRYLARGAAPVDLGKFIDIGARVTYHFGKDKQHNVFFGVDNICDMEYSTVPGYPHDGVQYKTGLSLRY